MKKGRKEMSEMGAMALAIRPITEENTRFDPSRPPGLTVHPVQEGPAGDSCEGGEL